MPASTECEVEELMAKPWAYPGLVVRSSESMLLSFSRNHSLHVWSLWALFSAGQPFVVRRIDWARGMDRVRVTGSAPSTFACEAPLSRSEGERLLHAVQSLVAAGVPKAEGGITIDGVACAVSVRNGGTVQQIEWRSGAGDAGPWDTWLAEAAFAANAALPRSSANLAYGAL